ncbi:MAG: substrate-binding domain-containing protein [Muribaculaceae bacterium]|nr:substrate-binding domain-containing protein [Muribaculaceae bacterium]
MKLTTAFKSLTALGMAILVVAAAGCTKYSKTPQAGSATNGITKLACDVTFENIMQQEIEVFEYIYPHADVLPYYLDEKSCIDSLLEQKVNAAVTTRPLNEAEKKYLKSKKKTVYERIIAIDAIALVVNNDNPIDRIDLKDLNDILTGKLQTWNQMGPGMKDLGSIDVVFDDESSSTVSFMRDSLMNGEPFGSNVYAQGSNESVYEAVKKKKNAIGVLGVSWLSADLDGKPASSIEELAKASERSDTTVLDFKPDIKVLKVQQPGTPMYWKPYQQYIYEGKYPLLRAIYMVTTSVPGTPAHGFYSFVTGVQGQKLILLTGILPSQVHPRKVQLL